MEAQPAEPWIGEVRHSSDGLVIESITKDRPARRVVHVGGAEVPSEGSIVLMTGGESPRIKRVIAPSNGARADVYRLAARFGLDPLFPCEFRTEVADLQAAPGIDAPELEDLEHLPFVTIDNEDSKDLDQALYIERAGNGFEVFYALADASHFIHASSKLFSEALRRGSSYYLPGLTLPMLPEPLSEGLISLNEGRRRRSLVFVMTLDRDGACDGTRIVQARIRSRRKLSYPQVQQFWDEPARSGFRAESFGASLLLLREVGHLRLADARRRHVVDYNRVELDIRTGFDGGFEIRTRDRLDVERCNEQISLLCNTEGAKLLADGRGLEHVQPVFRVHPAPTAETLEAFERLTAALVRRHGVRSSEWSWNREEEALDAFVSRLGGLDRPRLAAAIERQAIVMNRRSFYEIEPGAHHGIGAPAYARFSSPMREIVGIFTHKEALELLADPSSARPSAKDLELRDLVVEAGNRSKGLQRTLEKEIVQAVLDGLFKVELEQPLERRPLRAGTVLGLKPHLAYVRLDAPPVEIKIHFKDLESTTGKRWQVDPNWVQATAPESDDLPALLVGAAINLRVAGHDRKRRRWLFEPR
jgi:ribonuclease R